MCFSVRAPAAGAMLFVCCSWGALEDLWTMCAVGSSVVNQRVVLPSVPRFPPSEVTPLNSWAHMAEPEGDEVPGEVAADGEAAAETAGEAAEAAAAEAPADDAVAEAAPEGDAPHKAQVRKGYPQGISAEDAMDHEWSVRLDQALIKVDRA